MLKNMIKNHFVKTNVIRDGHQVLRRKLVQILSGVINPERPIYFYPLAADCPILGDIHLYWDFWALKRC